MRLSYGNADSSTDASSSRCASSWLEPEQIAAHWTSSRRRPSGGSTKKNDGARLVIVLGLGYVSPRGSGGAGAVARVADGASSGTGAEVWSGSSSLFARISERSHLKYILKL